MSPQRRFRARRWREHTRIRLRVIRGSLQGRVLILAVALGSIALAIVGAMLVNQIRNGLFTQRLDDVLQDSWRSTETAQAAFDASPANSPLGAQSGVRDTVNALREAGGADREVLLLQSPGDSDGARVNEVWTNPQMLKVVSKDLRDSTARSDKQQWQSVSLPDSGNPPGLVVAHKVQILGADYQLVFVYSLAADASTLALVTRVLGVGILVMVVAIALVIWLAMRQAVAPIRAASRIAGRLSAGDWSQRIQEGGPREVAILARSFNDMAQSLQEQFETMTQLSAVQRRFVSDVSHELRTPLTTIRMASDMISAGREQLPAELIRPLEILLDQLDRFDALLADLLEISRFDANAATLDSERIDLRGLVENVLDGLEPLAGGRHVALLRHIADQECLAEIDPPRIERIVRNLVINAVEHSEGKPVDIFVAAGVHCVAVVVRDHGIGLGPEQLSHVFDRFWRADQARKRTLGGTGLGLSISAEDARLHGGKIEVWGAEGQGASFRLLLPRLANGMLGEPPIDLLPAASEESVWSAPAHGHRDPGATPPALAAEGENA